MARTKQTSRKGTGKKPAAAPAPAGGKAQKRPVAGQKGQGAAGKKPHRFRPGTVALREIKKAQKSTEPLFSKAVLQRVVRDIVRTYNPLKDEIRFQASALNAVGDSLQAVLLSLLEDANKIALTAKRVTVFPKDIRAAVSICYPDFNEVIA